MADTNSANAATAEKPITDSEKVAETSAPVSAENGEGKATDNTGEDQAMKGVEKETESAPKGAEGESAAAEIGEKATSNEAKNDKQGSDRRQNGNRGRGRGRGNKFLVNREERERREKEFAALPITDDPNLIRQQVEFYLSDSNVVTDLHIFKEMEGAKNRPIPIKHLHTFKRMRRFQPYSAIVAALRESRVLEVVDTENYSGEGNEGVKRKVPVKLIEREGDKNVSLEEHHDRLMKRSMNNLDASIYAKNFGEEEVGQIELENFFRPYGAVMVRKRRDKDDKWKGSVFVEFQDAEAQKQFLSMEPPKFKDNQLVVMGKREYSKMKCEEKGITPAWELDSGAGQNTRSFNRDSGRGSRGRGGNRGGNRGHGRGRGRGRGRAGNNGGRDRNNRQEDSNGDPENGSKRKAESDDREEAKKARIEIKEDA